MRSAELIVLASQVTGPTVIACKLCERMKPFLQLFRLSVVGLSLLFPNERVSGLPAGFEDENVVQMNQVVDMAFAGNIMLAVTKDGKLYSYDLADTDGESKLAADLTDRICSNGERGYVHRSMDTLCIGTAEGVFLTLTN